MSFVVLERVNKVFPRPSSLPVQALRDFSLGVAERELLVLLGPSGSGKTTALRLIAGLDEPTSGSISVGGANLNRVPPKDRDVAMVFQHHALYPHMSVRENLSFGLRLRKVPKAESEQRVREMAELLGLGRELDALPAQLSGGQRQRVALGRALIRRPRVLLCDEPLSQLDAPLRAQLRAEFLRLRERLAVTILYVTHDQGEALTLGDRVAVIRDGALQQVDAPMRIYREPVNLFVAGFVGTPTTNLWEGTVTLRDGAWWFEEKTADSANGFALPVAEEHAGALRSHLGRPIIVGLRPEHVAVVEASRLSSPGMITAMVRIVERTGTESWLHCASAAQKITARAGAEAAGAKAGDSVRLVTDLSQARYFDPVTQQAIC